MTSENPDAVPKNQSTNADPTTPDKSEAVPQLPPARAVPPTQARPAPHSYQITCNKAKDRYDKIKFWVEIFGILFLIAYTYETYRTNNLTQCALNISKQQFTESQRVSKEQFAQAQDASARQFRAEERPYIWLTATGIGGPEYFYPSLPPTMKLDPKKVGQVTWSYHYTDYGKTPAYNVRTTAKLIKIGTRGRFQPSYRLTPHPGQGIPIPPGSDNFDTVVSAPPISADTFKHLIETDHAISIKITIEYTDAYGGRYETGMCFTRLKLNASEFCEEGNYIK
jgi:hypothetical protein